MDLREHFGLWKRCGNTRFFQKDPDNHWQRVYLNPLDGILVVLRNSSFVPGEPHYELTVKDASHAKEGAVEKLHSQVFRWIGRAVRDFFAIRAMTDVAEAIRERRGKPTPGDPPIRHLLNIYKSGGRPYIQEGRSPEGDNPFLEEMLEAVRLTISQAEGATVDYGRGLSEADAQEALEALGILEC